MSVSFLLFLLIGYLFIRLGKKFFSETKIKFVKQLVECTECAGIWIYTPLSLVMGEQLFMELFYVPFVSELATGAIVSLGVQLLELGWSIKFGVVVIE